MTPIMEWIWEGNDYAELHSPLSGRMIACIQWDRAANMWLLVPGGSYHRDLSGAQEWADLNWGRVVEKRILKWTGEAP